MAETSLPSSRNSSANTNGLTDAEVAEQLDSIALNELRQSPTAKLVLKDAARIIRSAALSELGTRDTARLDWLMTKGTPDFPWVAREGTTGRGYRLSQDPKAILHWGTAGVGLSPREAIDKAMSDERKGSGNEKVDLRDIPPE